MKGAALLLTLLVSGCAETGYEQNDGVILFSTWDEANGRREYPVAGADLTTFEVLNKQGYAKDRFNAYFRWKRIAPGDPASFMALSEIYARDRERVFYEDEVIPGADPASFASFAVQWGRDARDVYLQNRPIKACHPPTFVLLERDWQRDSRCVYNRGRKLPDADAATFTVLNVWYGKDARQVFHNDTRAVVGADAKSFVVAKPCEICGKDAARCYRYAKVVACGSEK